MVIESGSDSELPGSHHRIELWDWPVRLVHWSFALLVPLLWWTAQIGAIGWHRRLGLILLGLLVFRILWGFLGSETARFGHFVKGPRAVLGYLRTRRSTLNGAIGHNPIGGWSVLAMLGVMLAQVGLGLFSGDPDDGTNGPLNHLLSFSSALVVTEWHEALFNAVLALVVLHIAAVLFYLLVKRNNLVSPMVTGRKIVPMIANQPAPATAARLVICAIVAALVAVWLSQGAPGV